MKRIISPIGLKAALIALVALGCLTLLTACGGSATPTQPAPTDTSAPAAEVVTTPTQTGMIGETPTQGMAAGEVPAIEQDATTTSYKLHLRVGGSEKMLTLQEAKGATSGEVMVSGEMTTMMGGMAPNRHLEVKISDIKSGAVITDKSVSIEITNDASKETTPVQVAKMYGVAEGPSDTHFGNNIAFKPGNYTIKVNIAGETAQFNITIPQGSETPSAISSPMMGAPEATTTP